MDTEKTVPPPSAPSAPLSSYFPTLFRLLIGLLVVQQLLSSSLSLPRIQPVRYPAQPGQDVVYGLRVVSSPAATSKWCIELGKLGDDGFKVANSWMGMSDAWLYLRVMDGEETTLVLASLFQANLITRDEAESILSTGPARNLSLSSTIHRLPSLASLGASYYAGQGPGARRLLGPRANEGVVLPAAVGGASAAGVALISSRSTAFSGKLPVGTGGTRSIEELVPEGDFAAASADGYQPFTRLLLLAREEEEKEKTDFGRVVPLPLEDCQNLPAFSSPSSDSFGTASNSASFLRRFDEAVARLRRQREST